MKKVSQFLVDNLRLVGSDRMNLSELNSVLGSLESFFISSKIPLSSEKFFKKKYSDYSLALDCLILWNVSLTQIILANSPDLLKGKKRNQKEYFAHLIIHLTNNLFSIKSLLDLDLTHKQKIFIETL